MPVEFQGKNNLYHNITFKDLPAMSMNDCNKGPYPGIKVKQNTPLHDVIQ